MRMIDSVTVENGGKITLPDVLRDRYGLAADTRIRIIETRNGILLVPLTDEPMSEALAAELRDWQSLGTDALEMFPYDGDVER
jgi:bifunctional DNA-binding transcriptional regulator/antitoxin component of YhaV-PrlF toxin-antitoxin module